MTTEIMAPETDYYTDYASSMSAKSFVGQLLRHNRGDFIFGLDGDTLPAGTRLVAIAEELQIGWTRWENNSPAESRMGLLVEGLPTITRLIQDESVVPVGLVDQRDSEAFAKCVVASWLKATGRPPLAAGEWVSVKRLRGEG